MKELLIVFIMFYLPEFLFSQSKNNNCQSVKNGFFYYYPQGKSENYKIIRNGQLYQEINMQTNDTVTWRLNWNENCTFTLKFVEKSGLVSDLDKRIYSSMTIIIRILLIRKKYYIFSTELEGRQKPYLVTDTAWFNKK